MSLDSMSIGAAAGDLYGRFLELSDPELDVIITALKGVGADRELIARAERLRLARGIHQGGDGADEAYGHIGWSITETEIAVRAAMQDAAEQRRREVEDRRQRAQGAKMASYLQAMGYPPDHLTRERPNLAGHLQVFRDEQMPRGMFRIAGDDPNMHPFGTGFQVLPPEGSTIVYNPADEHHAVALLAARARSAEDQHE